MDSEDFKFGMTKVFFRPGKVRLSNEHRGLGTVCHYALARVRARVEPRSPSLKGKRDHDITSADSFAIINLRRVCTKQNL